MKLTWRVAPKPTGRYRSFEQRGWPTGYYPNGRPAVMLGCEDAYRPRVAQEGNHQPITVYIADHSVRERDPTAAAFVWLRMQQRCHSLKEAKALGQRALTSRPYCWPAGHDVKPAP